VSKEPNRQRLAQLQEGPASMDWHTFAARVEDLMRGSRGRIAEAETAPSPGASSVGFVIQKYDVSDRFTVEVATGLRVIDRGTPACVSQPATAGEDDMAALFSHARALDAQMGALRSQYAGEVIVYHDGRVLCSATTEEEAITRIPDDKRGLPLVVRRISIGQMVDFMGGPRGEQ